MLSRYMAWDSQVDFVDEVVDGPSVFLGSAPDNWATKKVYALSSGLQVLNCLVGIADPCRMPPSLLFYMQFDPLFAGPFKALPVVEHNGLTLNETGACSQYIAELLGYLPDDIGEKATVVMICDHIYEDVMINSIPRTKFTNLVLHVL